MSEDDNKKPSIFQKVVNAGEAMLDAQIFKSQSSIVMNQPQEDDFLYAKAITEDPTYSIHTQGWKDKPSRLQASHLKQMSINNTVAIAVIQTRQNQVAAHSRLVESEKEKGFMVKLRNEKELLDEIIEQLKAEQTVQPGIESEKSEADVDVDGEVEADGFNKAEDLSNDTTENDTSMDEQDANEVAVDDSASDAEDKQKSDDDVEEYNWELVRKAKEILEDKFKEDRKTAEDYILNCGLREGKTFQAKQWNFDKALRAWTRDTCTYDLYATEVVPDQTNKPHHWFPVDGSTIKFASHQLKNYKEIANNFMNLDLLYPEQEAQAMEQQKTLDLKPELLEQNAYRFVQVVRGKIERAYTEDEMKIGIRNANTDIYNAGYGIGELELAVGLITGHLNAEFYNQAYFTQGFSAKGILHIKAAINRRKIESVRQQWQHMIRGSKNSFQTPIFAGVDEVEWIPLTQKHEDIGFEGWMRYLIKMICAVYQIDPHEIGIGFKDEGGAGGGISGDNTSEKIKESKDKGLRPLIKHIQDYINEEILKPFDDRFVIEFTGHTSEDQQEALERQEKEVGFKKTVNEVRAEDGLPPLPGMDNVILNPDYMNWYMTFSKEAKDQQEQAMQDQKDTMDKEAAVNGEEDPLFDDEESMYNDKTMQDNLINSEEVPAEEQIGKSLKKSKKPKILTVEYYKDEE